MLCHLQVRNIHKTQANIVEWRLLAFKRLEDVSRRLRFAKEALCEPGTVDDLPATRQLRDLRIVRDRERAVLQSLQLFADRISFNIAHERGLRFLGILRPSSLSWGALLAGSLSIALLALRLAVTAYAVLP